MAPTRGEGTTVWESQKKTVELGRCEDEIDPLSEDTVGDLTSTTHLQLMTSNILPCSVLTKFDRQHLVDCINPFQGFL